MSANDNKRYYWLKLKKDFFKQHEIKIVESAPNGKDYILFYLKLLVESVSHEGKLRFSETIPYNEQMLSALTDTNVDVVKSAMKIFISLQMIDVLDDETIYMRDVENLIGSETGKAERMRVYREQLGEKNNATNGLQSGYIVAKRIENREKIKLEASADTKNNQEFENQELERNNQHESVFKLYQENIGFLTQIIGERIKTLVDEVGELKVKEAITEAATHNARNLAYIEAVARCTKPKPPKVNEMPGAERVGGCNLSQDEIDERMAQIKEEEEKYARECAEEMANNPQMKEWKKKFFKGGKEK